MAVSKHPSVKPAKPHKPPYAGQEQYEHARDKHYNDYGHSHKLQAKSAHKSEFPKA